MPKIDWSQYKEKQPDIDWSEYAENGSPDTAGSSWSSLAQGLKESYPASLKQGINAFSDLFGAQPFENAELEPTDNWPRGIGRFLGSAGGYSTLGAPFAVAGSALLPGLAGAALGSGAAGMALTKGGLKERMIGGLLSSAIPAGLKGVGISARLAKSSISSVKPRNAANIIQEAAAKAESEAIAPLNFASKEAAARNVTRVPIQASIFKDAHRVLPKTQAYKELVAKAKTGDYEALRQLQSDLGRRARTLSKSESYADQNLAEEVEQTRGDINESIYSHFEKEGHHDLAAKIKEGMEKYRKYMQLYHAKPTISKLVGTEKEVPSNLLSFIRKDSAYHDKLRNELPQLKKIIQQIEDKEKIAKIGKRVGYHSIGAAALKSLLPSSYQPGDYDE